MGSSPDTKFQGWLGYDKHAADGKLAWADFDPKTWEETDVDIKVSHCGICGSDIHTLRSGWGPTRYPVCVGHEIVGTVVRVGSEALKANPALRPGARVGVGAQSDSCQNRNTAKKCQQCASGQENYCPHNIPTYNGVYPDGSASAGGYATHVRCPGHFVIPIPTSIPSELAAPMLCAGVTTYAPLKRNGCGPGKTVGVVGLGGLGHFGVMWARALGADRVVVLSRRSDKRADALALGADDCIATEEDGDWVSSNAQSIDILLSTVSSSKAPMGDYLSLIRHGGVMVQVGAPDDGVFQVPAYPLIRGVRLEGSLVGSPGEIREMLDLAAEKSVKPWVTTRPMKDANSAIVDMHEGKARYRYVLVNEAESRI